MDTSQWIGAGRILYLHPDGSTEPLNDDNAAKWDYAIAQADERMAVMQQQLAETGKCYYRLADGRRAWMKVQHDDSAPDTCESGEDLEGPEPEF